MRIGRLKTYRDRNPEGISGTYRREYEDGYSSGCITARETVSGSAAAFRPAPNESSYIRIVPRRIGKNFLVALPARSPARSAAQRGESNRIVRRLSRRTPPGKRKAPAPH